MYTLNYCIYNECVAVTTVFHYSYIYFLLLSHSATPITSTTTVQATTTMP